MPVPVSNPSPLTAPPPPPVKPSSHDLLTASPTPNAAYRLAPPVREIISNPVNTRTDLVGLLSSLLAPLRAGRSPKGARVYVGGSGAHFDPVAAEMEGYARALWGLGPVWAGEKAAHQTNGINGAHTNGSPVKSNGATAANPNAAHGPTADLQEEMAHYAELWAEGLEAGCDEEGDEYWGDVDHRDQRLVEMAAIGFTLCIAPHAIWDPLSDKAKKSVEKWLLRCNELEYPENNWRFFRVFTNLGLKLVGAFYSQESIDRELAFIETFYSSSHSFPSDGQQPHCKAYDYYATSFAIPFYALIYSKLCGETDPARSAVYRRRALDNLPRLVNLFAPDGAAIAFGRSMTYRFAMVSFFSALPFALEESDLPAPFTWGMIKGLILRNIRYFSQRPECFDRTGTLTIGYTYPQMFMSEDYNSPQSPYWALKAFLILALPDSHPFWQAKEAAYPAQLREKAWTAVEPWMQVFSHAAGHTFCLSAGQYSSFPLRHAAAKYGKFAYSSHFGFSVPSGHIGLAQHCPDSVLALSDDEAGERWVVPRFVSDITVSPQGWIKSTWRPWSDVTVTTYLIPPSSPSCPYHTRIHHLTSSRSTPLLVSDAGFAIQSIAGPPGHERRLPLLPKQHGSTSSGHSVYCHSPRGVSGVIDLLRTGQASLQGVDANTNLISSRTTLPLVLTKVGTGETWLATRVWGVPDHEDGKGVVLPDWEGIWKQEEKETWDLERLKKEYPFIV